MVGLFCFSQGRPKISGCLIDVTKNSAVVRKVGSEAGVIWSMDVLFVTGPELIAVPSTVVIALGGIEIRGRFNLWTRSKLIKFPSAPESTKALVVCWCWCQVIETVCRNSLGVDLLS